MGAAKVARKTRIVGVDPQDFSPSLLRVQSQPPAPFARVMLRLLLVLLFALILWAAFGKLDIVATAEGKLIPQTYLKIVQPFEQGIASEILVSEGEHVQAGQVLMRIDTTLSDADGKAINTDYLVKRITLRRIDAELTDKEFKRTANDTEPLYSKALAQYQANRLSYQTALAQERNIHDKAQSDYAWVGVEIIAPGSRGYISDARQLYVLEAFMGKSYMQGYGANAGTPNTGWNAGTFLSGVFKQLVDGFYSQLMAQTFLKPVLDSISIKWNDATGQFVWDTTNTVAALQSLYIQQASPNHSESLNTIVKQMLGDRLDRSIYIQPIGHSVISVANAGNDTLNSGKVCEVLVGGADKAANDFEWRMQA